MLEIFAMVAAAVLMLGYSVYAGDRPHSKPVVQDTDESNPYRFGVR